MTSDVVWTTGRQKTPSSLVTHGWRHYVIIYLLRSRQLETLETGRTGRCSLCRQILAGKKEERGDAQTRRKKGGR